ncbi:MAG: hypothetical protein C5B47_04375 [Verrucomicrobia bacterium]|nr:MAG: hypothetical protein C5B47_04375 [Verrucomicrobiota bacterium]
MSSNERTIQTKVGLFMLLGLAAAGILIVYFGRLGEGMQHYYNLNIHYSNASGLKKGADVLLSGARIGRVAAAPSILSDMQGVTVPVMIYDYVKIPKGARFTIGSSGLLGDRFVDILVGKDIVKSPPIPADSIIQGQRETAIADIIATVNRVAEQASDLMTHLDTTVRDVDLVAKKIHTDLLKPDSLKNFSVALANLKTTSENFKQASKRMDGILTSAGSTIREGKKTFASAQTAAEEIRKTAADVRCLLQSSKQGQGTLSLLLNNEETAANLHAFILNLRKHGVLWYKNSAPVP